MSTHAAAFTSQNVTLPFIQEIYDSNFLDILLPFRKPVATPAEPQPTNPMIDALKAASNLTYTENGAPSYVSTESPTLDAFQGLRPFCPAKDMARMLDKAWDEDPALTLRIIWNTRSIHDGKGDKEVFYQSLGWLYEKHPRTAISNLRHLVDPMCTLKKGDKPTAPHGYWKDLLNIVAMAVCDQLRPLSYQKSTFLHKPRTPVKPLRGIHLPGRSRGTRGRGRGGKRLPTGRERGSLTPEQVLKRQAYDAAQRVEKQKRRATAHLEFHETLVTKLKEPRFRALYIAVARLFAETLTRDLNILEQLAQMPTGPEQNALSRQITLAGKWAPTPGGSHDRPTNLSTAIALLVFRNLESTPRPSLSVSLDTSALPTSNAHVVRSFYQRWVLTPLREAIKCPEPLMSANRWNDIMYTRVPSICMKQNTLHFFKHDQERFEKYLEDVEGGNRTISGATLMPHEILRTAMKFSEAASWQPDPDLPDVNDVRKRVAEAQLRTLELQWKAMVDRLRASGTLDNALAICDVSGSMGSIYAPMRGREVRPILPAVALSLLLAQLAKPPFTNNIITFSAQPEFVQLDPNLTLDELVDNIAESNWGMNTDYNAVFLDLLLPLAIKNNIKQEDMIKRLFVLSDMQFDKSRKTAPERGIGRTATKSLAEPEWETNYAVIEKAWREAGYELPEIVYWNLAAGRGTSPVLHDQKGVALMSGFSQAMMKVFLGEAEEGEAEEPGWDAMDVELTQTKVKEEFNPVDVMKKALTKKSFDGLVVLD